MKALTQIKHGKPNGDVVIFEPGDDVPADTFTKEEAQALVDAGAVGKEYDPDAPAPMPEDAADVAKADKGKTGKE